MTDAAMASVLQVNCKQSQHVICPRITADVIRLSLCCELRGHYYGFTASEHKITIIYFGVLICINDSGFCRPAAEISGLFSSLLSVCQLDIYKMINQTNPFYVLHPNF